MSNNNHKMRNQSVFDKTDYKLLADQKRLLVQILYNTLVMNKKMLLKEYFVF